MTKENGRTVGTLVTLLRHASKTRRKYVMEDGGVLVVEIPLEILDQVINILEALDQHGLYTKKPRKKI